MFRSSVWRRTINDLVHWHQEQASSTTIYILREFGPTGFLLKEEGETKTFKVLLGDPHSCNCSTFLKERDLCKHICWVLLKKFRLPRDHEYTFQLGLVEREINELLQGLHQMQTPRPPVNSPSSKQTPADRDGYIRQKDIDAEDICPICQEELLQKMLPVTYCKYGCGNSVHITCMKVWADHQLQSKDDIMVRCPLCREEFAPLKLLLEELKNSNSLITAAEKERLDKHLGIICNNCRVFPIKGMCYKCSECTDYHLCQQCFVSCCHSQHIFVFRQKRNQRWMPVEQKTGQPLTTAINVTDLENKGASNDEFLKQLDSVCSSNLKGLSEHVFKTLSSTMVRQGSKLLAPGQQCRICLKAFSLGQFVRQLPCRHKDNIIKVQQQIEPQLFIPGIGLTVKKKCTRTQNEQPISLQGQNSQISTVTQQDLTLTGLRCLQLNKANSNHPSIAEGEQAVVVGYHLACPPNPLTVPCDQEQINKTNVNDRSVISAVKNLSLSRNNQRHKQVQISLKKVVTGKPIRSYGNSEDLFLENLHLGVNFNSHKSSPARQEGGAARRASRQRGPLSTKSKHAPVSLTATDIALTMEEIPLSNSS
nr:PREDICTED: E3 ubiquitin-protein ligase ZSWIM2 isoform X2 [Latimeria chalumnae]|eukprot:XP_014351842.1 PREDICTED: E3 ubiquitin-protein ligase ZSWIM2 isoform X2 [Latimeria chalumnae]